MAKTPSCCSPIPANNAKNAAAFGVDFNNEPLSPTKKAAPSLKNQSRNCPSYQDAF
jgi:hypothetical protein